MSRQRLVDLLRETVRTGEFTLSSGKTSDFYVDVRQTALNPEALHLISQEIMKWVMQLGVSVIAGPVLGACPLVAGAGLMLWHNGARKRLNYVRTEAKGHGLGKLIEGPEIQRNDEVLVLDDVATSGGSLIKAIQALREAGAVVLWAGVVVDREEGAEEALGKIGVRLKRIFTKTDLLRK